MNSIGFKNFRRFAQFPSIDLGDVTILVGGNNSGKSTIVKALLLCVDNLRLMRMTDSRRGKSNSPLSFSKPIFRFDANEFHDVKINTFARAIYNKEIEDIDLDTLELVRHFSSKIIFQFHIGKFQFRFDVSGNRDDDSSTGDIDEILIQDTEANIGFYVNYDKQQMEYRVLNPDGREKVSLLFKLWEDYFKAKKNQEKADKEGDLEAISESGSKLDKIVMQINSVVEVDDMSELKDSDFTRILDKMLKDNNPIKANYYIPYSLSFNEVGEHVVLNVLSNIINYATSGRKTKPDKKNYKDPIEYLYACEEYSFFSENFKAINQDLDTIKRSYNKLALILNTLEVEYVSAHAANQNILYNTADRNDFIAKVVHEYYHEFISEGDTEHLFVTRWMQDFGIGVGFNIESIGGEAYRVFINDKDGTCVPLADKGMGSIQTMILLLRLATIICRNKNKSIPTTIIIEEPEQNLHPKMQSRLTELFYELVLNYNCQFIIETHSEYIVRKAQVLVAEANYVDEEDLKEHNPFKIYYLPEDGSDRYEMQFATSGRFINKFDEGFFDEAGKLNLKTLRKERSGK